MNFESLTTVNRFMLDNILLYMATIKEQNKDMWFEMLRESYPDISKDSAQILLWQAMFKFSLDQSPDKDEQKLMSVYEKFRIWNILSGN